MNLFYTWEKVGVRLLKYNNGKLEAQDLSEILSNPKNKESSLNFIAQLTTLSDSNVRAQLLNESTFIKYDNWKSCGKDKLSCDDYLIVYYEIP